MSAELCANIAHTSIFVCFGVLSSPGESWCLLTVILGWCEQSLSCNRCRASGKGVSLSFSFLTFLSQEESQMQANDTRN